LPPSRSSRSRDSSSCRNMDWLRFSPDELSAIGLSLKVSLWATVGSLPLGILVAMILARGRFLGRSLLSGIVYMPLVLPPVVTGYILLILLGLRGGIGAFLAGQV